MIRPKFRTGDSVSYEEATLHMTKFMGTVIKYYHKVEGHANLEVDEMGRFRSRENQMERSCTGPIGRDVMSRWITTVSTGSYWIITMINYWTIITHPFPFALTSLLTSRVKPIRYKMYSYNVRTKRRRGILERWPKREVDIRCKKI